MKKIYVLLKIKIYFEIKNRFSNDLLLFVVKNDFFTSKFCELVDLPAIFLTNILLS